MSKVFFKEGTKVVGVWFAWRGWVGVCAESEKLKIGVLWQFEKIGLLEKTVISSRGLPSANQVTKEDFYGICLLNIGEDHQKLSTRKLIKANSRDPQQSQKRKQPQHRGSRLAESEEGATRRDVSPTGNGSSGFLMCAV